MPRGHNALDLLEADHKRSEAIRSAVASSYGVGDDSAPWSEMFGGGGSASGMVVTPETAMRASAVHACVNVISSTVGTLPLIIYKRLTGGGKEVADAHPLYQLLHDAPNDLLTSCEFREMMQAHLCLRGNAYARVLRNGGGQVASIEPIHPDRVSVFRNGDNVTYSVQLPQGGPHIILSGEEMLHVRGLGPEGVLGYSPISLARESVGLALATERHGATLFGNGARPSGVLQSDANLNDDQAKHLKKRWKEQHGGAAGMNEIAILSNGLKYAGITMSNEDAQFLETRQYQLGDIARIFRVPPHKIGDLSKATFSNIEQQSIEFVTDCIRPWVVRWEQRMNKILLTPKERTKFFVEFRLEGLLRGDMPSRYASYNIGVNGGWLSPNEVRDIENMNPIEGGNDYRQPMNMAKLGDFAPQVTAGPAGVPTNPTNKNE